VIEVGGRIADLAAGAIFPFDLRKYVGKVPLLAAGARTELLVKIAGWR